MKASQGEFERAARVFRRHRGILRTGEAIEAGVHPRTLYAMRDAGVIQRLTRGLYRLADVPPLGNPDLVTVAMKAPNAVVCLLSALSFYDLTAQIPHAVYIAVQKHSHEPRLRHLPVRVFEFGGKAFAAGIEIHELDGVPVRIYSPEKTLADCFKYRNKLGLDVAVAALKLYAQRRSVNVDALMGFARICRVARVMQPYLAAIL